MNLRMPRFKGFLLSLTQHITASQLRGIRDLLGTTYDILLKETP